MSEAFIKQLEIEAQRQMIFEMAIFAIAYVLTMWVLYIVIKSAIRDGIKESGLVDRWKNAVEAARAKEATGDTIPGIGHVKPD